MNTYVEEFEPCWEDPGLFCAMVSGLYHYFDKDYEGFNSWIVNIKHRLFLPCYWDVLPNTPRNSIHIYDVYSSIIGPCVLEACKSNNCNECRSNSYKSNMIELSYLIKDPYLYNSCQVRPINEEFRDVAKTSSLALRYWSLYLYHKDVNTVRNCQFDYKDYIDTLDKLKLDLNDNPVRKLSENIDRCLCL